MTKENFANEDDLKWKMTSNGRVPQISKVKYLSNYWSDLLQIFIGEIPRKSSSKSRVWLCSAQLVFVILVKNYVIPVRLQYVCFKVVNFKFEFYRYWFANKDIMDFTLGLGFLFWLVGGQNFP